MSVAFDAVSSAQANTVTSLSWTHTPVGTPSAIAVAGGAKAALAPAFSAQTYGGASLGAAVQSAVPLGTTNRVELYGLASPLSGAQTVSFNVSNSPTTVFGGAITVTGSDATTAFSNSGTGNANNTTGTVTITSATGELAVSALLNSVTKTLTEAGSPGTQTNRYTQDDITFGGTMAGSTQPGAASVVMAYTWTGQGNSRWGEVAASFKAATTNIKTINGLAKASVKTRDGLAIASVKTINGLT